MARGLNAAPARRAARRAGRAALRARLGRRRRAVRLRARRRARSIAGRDVVGARHGRARRRLRRPASLALLALWFRRSHPVARRRSSSCSCRGFSGLAGGAGLVALFNAAIRAPRRSFPVIVASRCWRRSSTRCIYPSGDSYLVELVVRAAADRRRDRLGPVRPRAAPAGALAARARRAARGRAAAARRAGARGRAAADRARDARRARAPHLAAQRCTPARSSSGRTRRRRRSPRPRA